MISTKLTNHQGIDFFSGLAFARPAIGSPGTAWGAGSGEFGDTNAGGNTSGFDFYSYDSLGNQLSITKSIRLSEPSGASPQNVTCSVSHDGAQHITFMDSGADVMAGPTASVTVKHRMWDGTVSGAVKPDWVITAPSVTLTSGATQWKHSGYLRITKNDSSALWYGDFTTRGATGDIDKYKVFRIFVDGAVVYEFVSPYMKQGSAYSTTDYSKLTAYNGRTFAITKLTTTIHNVLTGAQVAAIGIPVSGLNKMLSCADNSNSYILSFNQSRLYKIDNETMSVSYIDYAGATLPLAANIYTLYSTNGNVIGQSVNRFVRFNEQSQTVEVVTGNIGTPKTNWLNVPA